MRVWAIVVAGGRGDRFGGAKQYAALAGRRVLDWSLAAASNGADGVVLVVPPERVAQAEPGADRVVAGGASRAASVRAGLAAVPPEAEVIVVHDGARPLASPWLFASVIAAVGQGWDAAVPGLEVTDTIRHRQDGVIDRQALVRVQTPQAFAAAALRAAHAQRAEATDDASLVERQGGRVAIVAGETSNLKITDPDDLVVAEALLDRRRPPAAAAQPIDSSPGTQLNLRVGHGFDVHPFSTDPHRRLVLGGVHFPGQAGLVGHSDADVIAHAVIDALLGAAGLGDIGQHFPDTDPALVGADSVAMLAQAVALVAEAGWRVSNVDCTVVLEAPKLAPRKAEIERRLSAVVGAPVTAKAKRAEGLGSLGRREGVACFAVAILLAAKLPGANMALST